VIIAAFIPLLPDWLRTVTLRIRLLGGKPGEPFRRGISFCKVEEKIPSPWRTVGGDIGWPSSKTWSDQLAGKAWNVVKKQALKRLGVD